MDGMAKSIGMPVRSGAPVLRCDVGPVWITSEMSDAAALAALKPDMSALAEWSVSINATGVTVFAASGEPCGMPAIAGGLPVARSLSALVGFAVRNGIGALFR